jgi:hypothetical protein
MADNTDPAFLPGADDKEKLDNLCKRPYQDQAVWFLNAFFEQYEAEAETLWKNVAKYVEIDVDNKEEGCEVNELEAHRFLEAFDETMTVREMRTELRKSGAVGQRYASLSSISLHMLCVPLNEPSSSPTQWLIGGSHRPTSFSRCVVDLSLSRLV